MDVGPDPLGPACLPPRHGQGAVAPSPPTAPTLTIPGPFPEAGLSPEAVGFAVPLAMARLAPGSRAVPVWHNQEGGTFTCALYAPGAERPERYLKWAPAGSPARLEDEA